MDKDQIIQAYLTHQLTDKERQEFEELLQNDDFFKIQFEEHRAVFNAFKINEAERLKMNLNALEQNDRPKAPFNRRPLYFSLAATVLVLLGLSIYFNFYQTSLYNQYFEIYPNVYQPVVRGNPQEETKAFMYYENQDYTKAQNAFEDLLKNDDNPNLRFYYALSLLNDDKVEAAVSEFKILEDIDFEFQAEVYWYHALALIKLDRQEEAKVLLQTIKAKDFSFNRDKVDTLLEKLK